MTEQPWEHYFNVVKVSSPIDLLMIHYPMYHKDNENQTTRWYSTSINNPTILIKCIAFPIHKMAWEAEQGDISERENESQEMRDGRWTWKRTSTHMGVPDQLCQSSQGWLYQCLCMSPSPWGSLVVAWCFVPCCSLIGIVKNTTKNTSGVLTCGERRLISPQGIEANGAKPGCQMYNALNNIQPSTNTHLHFSSRLSSLKLRFQQKLVMPLKCFP